jgi:hypothetical protein
MTLDSFQNVAFRSISPITYLLPVPKGRPDGASVVTDGWRRPENALRVPLLENEFRAVAKQPQLRRELTANPTFQGTMQSSRDAAMANQ